MARRRGRGWATAAGCMGRPSELAGFLAGWEPPSSPFPLAVAPVPGATPARLWAGLAGASRPPLGASGPPPGASGPPLGAGATSEVTGTGAGRPAVRDDSPAPPRAPVLHGRSGSGSWTSGWAGTAPATDGTGRAGSRSRTSGAAATAPATDGTGGAAGPVALPPGGDAAAATKETLAGGEGAVADSGGSGGDLGALTWPAGSLTGSVPVAAGADGANGDEEADGTVDATGPETAGEGAGGEAELSSGGGVSSAPASPVSPASSSSGSETTRLLSPPARSRPKIKLARARRSSGSLTVPS